MVHRRRFYFDWWHTSINLLGSVGIVHINEMTCAIPALGAKYSFFVSGKLYPAF